MAEELSVETACEEGLHGLAVLHPWRAADKASLYALYVTSYHPGRGRQAKKLSYRGLGMVAHAFNLRTQEADR